MASENINQVQAIAPDGDNRERDAAKASRNVRKENGAIAADTSAQDVIIDAITTLAGISEALGYRTAVFHDEMLEMLARAAELQADELRELIGNE